ncbi:MAG: ATP-dependent DNA helicase [Erysipelotrichaceae bacterium]|nr:ATP-dependent DNA helicase [Erysipelotrichaceae bacterium]
MKDIVLSVHGLVDFLLRSGNIDNRIFNNASMAEGTRIHLRYQQIQNNNYISEEELSCEVIVDDFRFLLSGRADGIIIGKKFPIIDEIKSTVIELEKFYEENKNWHLGQAKVYAYMYAKENSLDTMGVRLTYISQKDDEDKLLMNFTYSFLELEEYVTNLCVDYLSFYRMIDLHKNQVKISSDALEFPYGEYRLGQRELAKYVYGTILNDDTLFIEAPTGIGKTISTLFPAIKSIAKCGTEKIFYLSAKAMAKEVAFDASKLMISKGLDAKVIKLNSKEKMCFTGEHRCNPDECPFTIGYYDKLRTILTEIVQNESIINDEIIYKYANRYQVCPFELQLDVSLFCDVVICDYNYVFDPIVYLKRYFEISKTNYVALIDETHNLVDRSREMYSTTLELDEFVAVQKKLRKFKHPKFKRALKKIIVYLNDIKECDDEYMIQEGDFDPYFYELLMNYFRQCQDILKNYPDVNYDIFIDNFRNVNRFLKISEFIGKGFTTYYQKSEDNLFAIIKCVDSSSLVKDTLRKLKASIFFSATLTPIEYYVNCLGGNEDTPVMKLESPFPKENCLTLVRTDLSTRYKDRINTYQKIADTIDLVINKKVGNYLVFFSSYQYLEEVYSRMNFKNDIRYIKQTRDMEDRDKDKFLSFFELDPSKTTVGFAVLGGIFSEGIDFYSDKLIGAIVVGVGIPQISFERDLIKEHFESEEINGYEYAYVNPGITKIIQAAGRVIRSENDKGIIVFIDDRFTQYKYRNILKKQYKNNEFVNNERQIDYLLEQFWKKNK